MKIYRFEKSEPYRVECIKDGNIYISKPEMFNDLDDCRLSGIYTKNYERAHYQKIKECLDILYGDDRSYFPLPSEILTSLRGYFLNADPSQNDSLKAILDRAGTVAGIKNYLRSKTGVCCFFQGMPTHPLMWAHYASSHTGFCIEYDVDEQADIPLYEVSYTNKLPSPSIEELLFCPDNTFLKILTTKSIEWSYEKEIRLVYLNEIGGSEAGKIMLLPNGMKPVRIIKGSKFNNSSDTAKLLEEVDIEKILYKNFVRL